MSADASVYLYSLKQVLFVRSAACCASPVCHVMASIESAFACSMPSSVYTSRYISDILEQAGRQKAGRSARQFRRTQNAAGSSLHRLKPGFVLVCTYVREELPRALCKVRWPVVHMRSQT